MSNIVNPFATGPRHMLPEEGTGGYSVTGMTGIATLDHQWRSKWIVGLPNDSQLPEGIFAVRTKTPSNGWLVANGWKEDARSALDKYCEENGFANVYNGKTIPSGLYYDLQMHKDTVLTGDNADWLNNWGDLISFGTDYKASQKSKSSHRFHQIFLPSMVAAMARYLQSIGLIPEDVDTSFPLEPLNPPGSKEEQNAYWTAEIAEKLIGMRSDGSVETGKAEEVAASLNKAMLWQNRTRLWEALGEDDPFVVSSARASNPNSYFVQAITVVESVWPEGTWATIGSVTDPAVFTKDEDHRNLSVPVVVEIHGIGDAGREAAQAYFDSVQERFSKNSDSTPSSFSEYPDIPAGWEGVTHMEFLDTVKNTMSPDGPAAKRALDLSKSLEISNDLAAQWIAFADNDIPF